LTGGHLSRRVVLCVGASWRSGGSGWGKNAREGGRVEGAASGGADAAASPGQGLVAPCAGGARRWSDGLPLRGGEGRVGGNGGVGSGNRHYRPGLA